MNKAGRVLAAAVAAVFVAGCAQPHHGNAPKAKSTHYKAGKSANYKGQASCKGKNSCKGRSSCKGTR